MSLFAATAGEASKVLATTAAMAAAANAPRAPRTRLFDSQTTSSIPLPSAFTGERDARESTVSALAMCPQSFSDFSERAKQGGATARVTATRSA
jgi:hypothetical protein